MPFDRMREINQPWRFEVQNRVKRDRRLCYRLPQIPIRLPQEMHPGYAQDTGGTPGLTFSNFPGAFARKLLKAQFPGGKEYSDDTVSPADVQADRPAASNHLIIG